MIRPVLRELPWLLVLLLPSVGFAQSAGSIVLHPALESASDGAGAMPPTHQLGKFGESFIGENLRASGYEVHDANLNDRGIDLLAVKRNPQGELVEVRPIEVKTRSRGVNFRLERTQDGPQLSAEWTDKRLAQLAVEHPNPTLRHLAAEVLTLKHSHPERIRPQLHGLSIGDNAYQVFRVEPKSGAIQGLESGSSLTRFLKRLTEADVSPATRQAAVRHLQRFDQIQAGIPVRQASAGAATARSVTPTGPAPKQVPGEAAKAVTEAAEAVAAESGVIAKALPVAAKTVAVAGMIADGVTRGYQAYQVERQFQRGEVSDRDRVLAHTKNGGGMALGWTGAAALGSQGVAWGSVFGPLGTAGGGVIGGVAGYFGGEKLAEVVVDHGADAIYAGISAARDGVGWVDDRASRLWRLTKHQFGW